jgi:hypothetical protein
MRRDDYSQGFELLQLPGLGGIVLCHRPIVPHRAAQGLPSPRRLMVR